MNDLHEAPETVEREVTELAQLLLNQAQKVKELACLLVDQIERRIEESGES